MESITITTTRGLSKTTNEDVVGIRDFGADSVICLCDGHWGKTAADLTCRTLLDHFPRSKTQAVSLLKDIERQLFTLSSSQKPPETSVLAIKINFTRRVLTYVSYGDCRMIVGRSRKIIYSLPIFATWLGALSFQKLRNRIPVPKATIFGRIHLQPGDKVLCFSDGVDECVYDHPTIPHSWLLRNTAENIFRRIKSHGAQDNASLVIIKC